MMLGKNQSQAEEEGMTRETAAMDKPMDRVGGTKRRRVCARRNEGALLGER